MVHSKEWKYSKLTANIRTFLLVAICGFIIPSKEHYFVLYIDIYGSLLDQSEGARPRRSSAAK